MSEYQYYEFVAVDRPLTDEQMEEVRRVSSRAEITRTRFANEYNYGDFRGNVREFLTKYYDALVYVANWGTHRFAFRVPAMMVDIDQAKQYCQSDSAEVRRTGEYVIFDLTSQEDAGEWEEGEAWLASLLPLRAELLEGDHRVLYMAWLMAVQSGEVDEDETEPPVPPGMKELTAAQAAFAEFMRIDEDLLAAAAANSTPMPRADEGLAQWISSLPVSDKDAILLAICEGQDPHAAARLRRRFQDAQERQNGNQLPAAPLRTVGELHEAALTLGRERRMEAERQKAARHARQEAEAAAKRAEYLASLAGRQEPVWTEVEELIATRQPGKYARVVELLRDLREVATQTQAKTDFEGRLKSLRDRHASKSAFQRRLREAGL